ncbi:histidine kinase [Actinoplanes cyaneus]|uniref:histidine kinase n=1 Tax=Actinoplanes cyaneus TaxID=52696 RepID=A0A919IBC0_9ACTN|nr:sensor histidine kinase [Actinoplanes cyaneus]MCW2136152.1 Signal transduction histidine kinase [Actinoplanes cyaneus]GID62478.1 histidine kinase [Actinoplanes cyaneus]
MTTSGTGTIRRAGQATAYLLRGGVTGVTAVGALLLLVVAAALCPVLIGVPLLARAVRGGRSLAAGERRRAGLLLGEVVPRHDLESSGSSFAQLRTLTRDPAAWRDLAWLVLHAVTAAPLAVCWLALWVCAVLAPFVTMLWWAPSGAPIDFFVPIDSWSRASAVPLPVAAGSAALLIVAGPVVASAQARVCRALLAPSARDRLTARVEQLSSTRAAALDAHALELRRIERDLHDGIQAHLVAVAIKLGLAQRQRRADPDAADNLVEGAHAGVEHALTTLREVVRTIYPPILADRGLAEAVRTLAAESPVPVRASIGALARPPAAVESAAYFVVAEALTNVVKHSGATEITLSLDQGGDRLVVEVSDNGCGGADPSAGTGLAGMTDRAAALDGRMTLRSPAGGPTTVRVELPCVS